MTARYQCFDRDTPAHTGTDLLKPHVIFPVSGEYDLSALFADISSMLIGKGILIYPCVCYILVNIFVINNY